MSAGPISLDELNHAPRGVFVATLEKVFEHAPWIAEAASARRPFDTVGALHDAMMQIAADAPPDRMRDFLRGHPQLSPSALRSSATTAESVAEQTGLGIGGLAAADADDVDALNAAYSERFGFPFIICVRRQTLDATFAAFRRRLKNSLEQELEIALNEIRHITRLRLVDLVSGPGTPATTGHLSTHVLDTYHGEPACDVKVELFELVRGARMRLASARTNRAGRTDAPLFQGAPLRMGSYELVFGMGDYFARRGAPLSEIPFLGDIVLRVGIDQPEGRYHIPLVATPWSYSTYRGS